MWCDGVMTHHVLTGAMNLWSVRLKNQRIENAIRQAGAKEAQVQTLLRLLGHVHSHGFSVVVEGAASLFHRFSVSKQELSDVHGTRCLQQLADRLGIQLVPIEDATTNWTTAFDVYPSKTLVEGPTWKEWFKATIRCRRATDLAFVRDQLQSLLADTKQVQQRAVRVLGPLTEPELRIVDALAHFVNDDTVPGSSDFVFVNDEITESRVQKLARACDLDLEAKPSEPAAGVQSTQGYERKYTVKALRSKRPSWCLFAKTATDDGDMSMGEIVASYKPNLPPWSPDEVAALDRLAMGPVSPQ
jgi:hypothetical protein